jgi:hypothetical protein
MKLPIDPAGVLFTCAGIPEAVMDWDDRTKPETDEAGRPIFRVSLLAIAEGPGEVIPVKVAGEPSGLVPNTAVKVTGLSAEPWTSRRSGRSGVTYWAKTVEPNSAARPERAAS